MLIARSQVRALVRQQRPEHRRAPMGRRSPVTPETGPQCPLSSVGQSVPLVRGRSPVRVREGALSKYLAPVAQRPEQPPCKRSVPGSTPGGGSPDEELTPVAQWIEQPPSNRSVLGSIPSRGTGRQHTAQWRNGRRSCLKSNRLAGRGGSSPSWATSANSLGAQQDSCPCGGMADAPV